MQAVLERMTPAFVYDPTLVLYLPLRQLDSASFADRSAYGHLCIRVGATWRPNGCYFDGVDDDLALIDAPRSLWQCPATASKTWLIWFKNASAGDINGYIFGQGRVGENPAYYLRRNGAVGAAPHFVFRDAAGTTTNVYGFAPGIDNWTFVAVVLDRVAGTLTLMQGVGYTSSVATTLGVSSTRELRLVCDPWGITRWGGTVGEVRVYTRALFPAEIQRIFLETRGQYA